MKRGSLVSLIIYAVIAGIIIFLMVLLFRALVPEPPQLEVEMARAAIAKARDHQSEVYSPKLFREAQNNYDSAMTAWRAENERYILFRDYERVTAFAAISAEKGQRSHPEHYHPFNQPQGKPRERDQANEGGDGLV